MTTVDIQVYKVNEENDLFIIEMKEQVVHDVAGIQLTDVSHKMFVNKDDMMHIMSVMNKVLLV